MYISNIFDWVDMLLWDVQLHFGNIHIKPKTYVSENN